MISPVIPFVLKRSITDITTKSVTMKKVSWIYPIVFAAIIFFISTTCKKDQPESQTQPATNLSKTGVTLKGTVNPNGLSTTVTFEYGTTTSYDSSVTAAQSPVTGDGISNVSADISGLTIGTIYYYRVKAENSHWTVYSSYNEFEYGYPPSVTTLGVANVKTCSATLNGSVNPGGLPTTVTFEYGTSTDYGQQATTEESLINGNTITDISANISGLACNTIYHFRLKAENSFDTTYTSDKTFLTAAGPPDAITLDAVRNTGTTATLKGSVQASCVSFVVTFEYGTDMANYEQELTPDQTLVTADGITEVSRNISGLTPCTTYHFRVKTESSFGASYGSDKTIKERPPALTTTSISGITATAAISGGNITEGCSADITDRGVEWALWPLGGLGCPRCPRYRSHDGTGTGSFTSTMTGLRPSTAYYVRAYATTRAGTGYGNLISFKTASN